MADSSPALLEGGQPAGWLYVVNADGLPVVSLQSGLQRAPPFATQGLIHGLHSAGKAKGIRIRSITARPPPAVDEAERPRTTIGELTSLTLVDVQSPASHTVALLHAPGVTNATLAEPARSRPCVPLSSGLPVDDAAAAEVDRLADAAHALSHVLQAQVGTASWRALLLKPNLRAVRTALASIAPTVKPLLSAWSRSGHFADAFGGARAATRTAPDAGSGSLLDGKASGGDPAGAATGGAGAMPTAAAGGPLASPLQQVAAAMAASPSAAQGGVSGATTHSIAAPACEQLVTAFLAAAAAAMRATHGCLATVCSGDGDGDGDAPTAGGAAGTGDPPAEAGGKLPRIIATPSWTALPAVVRAALLARCWCELEAAAAGSGVATRPAGAAVASTSATVDTGAALSAGSATAAAAARLPPPIDARLPASTATGHTATTPAAPVPAGRVAPPSAGVVTAVAASGAGDGAVAAATSTASSSGGGGGYTSSSRSFTVYMPAPPVAGAATAVAASSGALKDHTGAATSLAEPVELTVPVTVVVVPLRIDLTAAGAATLQIGSLHDGIRTTSQSQPFAIFLRPVRRADRLPAAAAAASAGARRRSGMSAAAGAAAGAAPTAKQDEAAAAAMSGPFGTARAEAALASAASACGEWLPLVLAAVSALGS